MKTDKRHTPEELVNIFKKDFNKGTELFVEEYREYIEIIAAKFLERYSPDIDIIFSDVLYFVIVEQGIFKLKNPKWLKSWLYAIVRNKVRSFYRKQCCITAKHEHYFEKREELNNDFPFPDKGDVETVLRFMTYTGDGVGATLLVEHFLNGLTYDQIVEKLSIKRHKVYSEIQKAKKVFTEIYSKAKA